MKFTIERDALAKALDAISAAVPSKATVPILTSFLVEARDDQAWFTASNLDMQASVSVDAIVDREGAVALEAARVHGIARQSPDGAQIEFAMQAEGDDNRCSVNAGRSRFKLATLPKEDFPLMAEGTAENAVTLSGEQWAGLVERSAFAIEDDKSRPYLSGLHLQMIANDSGQWFRAVGMSGKGSAYDQVEFANDGQGRAILPMQAVKLSAQLAAAAKDEDISLAFSERQAVFEIGRVTILTKLLDGDTPDYERLIPWKAPHVFRADSAILEACINRCLIVAQDDHPNVKIVAAPGKLAFSARNMDTESANEEMDIEWAGEELEFTMDGILFLKYLDRIRSEETRIFFTDKHSPLLLLAAPLDGDPDPTAMSIVMPKVI